MSTISLPYEKQIRHFFVADAISSETTIQTFISTASIGEMQIFDQDGQVVAGPLSRDFYLTKKNYKGGISNTDYITPKDIVYLNGTSPRAKIGKTQTFTLGSTPTVSSQYQFIAKVNYGNSEENFITFWANTRVKTGDTENDVLCRLAKSMMDNLAKSINTTAQPPLVLETICGTAAQGSVNLDSGASGSVDGITVDGVEIMSGAEAFDTDLTTTAANVADNINAYTSDPNYTATSTGAKVFIVAETPGTETGTVVATTTTITTTDVDLGTEVAGTSTETAYANKYFRISVLGSVMTIREKDWILDEFRVGLRTYDQLLWNFEIQANDPTGLLDVEQDNITKGGTPPVFATGQGYQIIELERYLVGHRAEFELKDYTLGFGRPYDTVITSQYYVLDLKYFDTSRQSEKHSDKMLTIVSTDVSVINDFGDAIELAGGPVWTTIV